MHREDNHGTLVSEWSRSLGLLYDKKLTLLYRYRSETSVRQGQGKTKTSCFRRNPAVLTVHELQSVRELLAAYQIDPPPHQSIHRTSVFSCGTRPLGVPAIRHPKLPCSAAKLVKLPLMPRHYEQSFCFIDLHRTLVHFKPSFFYATLVRNIIAV